MIASEDWTIACFKREKPFQAPILAWRKTNVLTLYYVVLLRRFGLVLEQGIIQEVVPKVSSTLPNNFIIRLENKSIHFN
ncbi:hypothetical protein ACUXCC_004571 [Cytobacillus horneckiae]|uniref:hypothetical protein n=1 Tax=Cytobacillus horneckiae TaxID=549687 RepID=UPI000A79DDA2|nr:hypothetical protein [Cytobacillus horneckiae]